MRHVLSIDVRNATRSQIAEGWFNHLAVGLAQARSCGTMPSDHVSGRTIQVMQEVGINTCSKQPTSATQRLMNWADVVVILGTGIFPRAFMPTQVWDFEDPTHKSLDQLRLPRDEIRTGVESLISEIRKQDLVLIQTSQILPPSLQPVWN